MAERAQELREQKGIAETASKPQIRPERLNAREEDLADATKALKRSEGLLEARKSARVSRSP